MEVGKILPVEAAAILHASPQFVRVAMQQEKLPIGTAIKMSSIWTYNISEKLLAEYSGKNIREKVVRKDPGSAAPAGSDGRSNTRILRSYYIEK